MRRLLLILCILLAACERPNPSAPLPHQKVRIAADSPAIGVILVDLKYDDLCVGRHGFDRALHPSIPVIGTQTEIDYEALIKVHPTHLFTQWGSRDLPPKLTELAHANNWKVTDFRLLSLADIREATTQIDQQLCEALGEKAPSPAAAHLFADMDKAWSPRPSAAKAGRVLLLAAANPPAAFGPGSCHYELLQKLGVTPAITSGSPYINLDSEDILKLAPDAVILIEPRPMNTPPPSPEQAKQHLEATLAGIKALNIPATKSSHLAILDNPLGVLPGTSMIRLAEDLAHQFDAWAGK